MEDNNILKFDNLGVWKSEEMVLDNFNMAIAGSESLLLISSTNKGVLSSILSLDIDDDLKMDGKMEYRGKELLKNIKNIKRYSDKDKNLMKVSETLKEIFVIQRESYKIMDKTLTLGEQIIDFIPYNARVRMLNAVLRREMISSKDVELLISNYEKYPDKEDYVRFWSTEYGVVNKTNDIYHILQGNENKTDKLKELLIFQKTGIDLPNIVELRDFYKYVTGLNTNTENKKSQEEYDKLMKEKKRFAFFKLALKLNRKGIEDILTRELKRYMLEYLKFMGFSNDESILNVYPSTDSEILIKHLFLAILIFSDAKLLVFECSKNIEKFLGSVNLLRKTYGFGVICISEDAYVLKTMPGLFDYVKVIYSGKTVEDAPVDQFTKEQLHPYSKSLMSGKKNITGSYSEGCVYYKNCRYSMAICKNNTPDMINFNEKRNVACFIYGNKNF